MDHAHDDMYGHLRRLDYCRVFSAGNGTGLSFFWPTPPHDAYFLRASFFCHVHSSRVMHVSPTEERVYAQQRGSTLLHEKHAYLWCFGEAYAAVAC